MAGESTNHSTVPILSDQQCLYLCTCDQFTAAREDTKAFTPSPTPSHPTPYLCGSVCTDMSNFLHVTKLLLFLWDYAQPALVSLGEMDSAH